MGFSIDSFSPPNGPVGTQVKLQLRNVPAGNKSSTTYAYVGATECTDRALSGSTVTIKVPEGATTNPIKIAFANPEYSEGQTKTDFQIP